MGRLKDAGIHDKRGDKEGEKERRRTEVRAWSYEKKFREGKGGEIAKRCWSVMKK